MRSILPVLICPVMQAIAQIHNKSARNDWNRLLFVLANSHDHCDSPDGRLWINARLCAPPDVINL